MPDTIVNGNVIEAAVRAIRDGAAGGGAAVIIDEPAANVRQADCTRIPESLHAHRLGGWLFHVLHATGI